MPSDLIPDNRNALRVLIADDHELFALGLAALLQRENTLEVVGIAKTGPEAIALWDTLRPAVTLLDLRMQGLTGIETLCSIRALDASASVVILSVYESEEDVMLAFRNGAQGYLLKDLGVKDLVESLHKVAGGTPALSPSTAARLARGTSQVQLTTREFLVLRLLAKGQPNKEIADTLCVTVATIKAHMTHLFEKLGVTNRTAAIAAAHRRGLVRGAW